MRDEVGDSIGHLLPLLRVTNYLPQRYGLIFGPAPSSLFPILSTAQSRNMVNHRTKFHWDGQFFLLLKLS